MTLLLVLGLACPSVGQLMEVYELPEGCPAPVTGWLYTPKAFKDNAKELKGLEVLVKEARRERDAAHRMLETTVVHLHDARKALGAAEKTIEKQAQEIEACDEPSRAVWFLAGAGSVVALFGVVIFL